MPPKSKFTKEQITAIALDIVRSEGFENLTARALGKKLDSSSCPIFTVFENMDEVQQAVTAAAKALYKEYIDRALSSDNAFKSVGMQYILFAVNEPKLFQILFMSEHSSVPTLDGILPLIDESYDKILSSITAEWGLKGESAKNLYQHLWVYSHGIATLCATKMCRFTEEETVDMLTEVCRGILNNMKAGKDYD